MSNSRFASQRIDEALRWAVELHAGQMRKGSTIPYVSHLLGVAGLVLEDGGDEDEFIAGLLHDSIEDADVAAAEIEGKFGARVRRLVEAATDTLPDGRRGPDTWRERKERVLAHIASLPVDARRVTLADKLHNARAILKDYRIDGDSVWSRFNAGRDDQIWFYQGLAEAYGDASGNAKELRRVVDVLTTETASPHQSRAGGRYDSDR